MGCEYGVNKLNSIVIVFFKATFGSSAEYPFVRAQAELRYHNSIRQGLTIQPGSAIVRWKASRTLPLAITLPRFLFHSQGFRSSGVLETSQTQSLTPSSPLSYSFCVMVSTAE